MEEETETKTNERTNGRMQQQQGVNNNNNNKCHHKLAKTKPSATEYVLL